MSAHDDKLLAAALEVAARSIRDVWEDGSIPRELALWRLSNTQLLWIAAQAIFAWQAERRRQAIEARADMDEMLKTFVEPRFALTPDQEALASALLPMLREYVTTRGLHLKPIGQWRREDVALMLVRVVEAGLRVIEARDEVPFDVDELPIEAGRRLAAG